MTLVYVGTLPDAPLAAAAAFYAQALPRIGDGLPDEALTLVFRPADHTHHGWRLAVVQELARARAPRRVNAVASDDPRAIAAAERYLAQAAGITGQLLALDGNGAGEVLS